MRSKPTQPAGSPRQRTTQALVRLQTPFSRYAAGLLLVVVTTVVGLLIRAEFSPTNLVMLYLLAVVVGAIYLGRGPAVLVSALGVLAFDFFFVPPRFTFSVASAEYLLTFLGLFLVGLVISALTARAREQAEAAERREAETAALYSLSRDLAAAEDAAAVVRVTRAHVEDGFARQAVVYLPEGESLRPSGDASADDMPWLDPALAQRVFVGGEAAGRGTPLEAGAAARYLPLTTSRGTVGVLAVRPIDGSGPLSPQARRLLEAFASQAAQALERVQLVEATRQMQVLQATEKFQSALLHSISHDLRTPLVTITGALTTLQERGQTLDPEVRTSLVDTASEEADRLDRLVGNLLDMTRLEAGALRIRREPTDMQDLIGAVLAQMDRRLAGHPVKVDVPDSLPIVYLDYVLIVQVLHNLLDNAVKYSPPAGPLEVAAQLTGDEVQISVLDAGVGIPEADLSRVFDKFYRVRRPEQVSGTGLGLAICKGIVEAHGGRIWAANRPGGGAVISFRLPVGADGTGA
jgi:two-component system sensor histidine kinase KdpD